jgi:hypothetical protein
MARRLQSGGFTTELGHRYTGCTLDSTVDDLLLPKGCLIPSHLEARAKLLDYLLSKDYMRKIAH